MAGISLIRVDVAQRIMSGKQTTPLSWIPAKHP